jgi:hypothetical protein
MKGKEQQQLANLARMGKGAETSSLDPLMTLLVQVVIVGMRSWGSSGTGKEGKSVQKPGESLPKRLGIVAVWTQMHWLSKRLSA